MKKLWAWLTAMLSRPTPVEYEYKWVRTHLMGEPDEANVLRHERAGWQSVPDDEIPTYLAPERTPTEKWARNGLLNAYERNSYGGLRLYRLPKAEAIERETYYVELSREAGHRNIFIDPKPKYPPKDDGADHGPRHGELWTALEEYYSEENRTIFPERQREYEESERNLAAKGLSFK